MNTFYLDILCVRALVCLCSCMCEYVLCICVGFCVCDMCMCVCAGVWVGVCAGVWVRACVWTLPPWDS